MKDNRQQRPYFHCFWSCKLFSFVLYCDIYDRIMYFITNNSRQNGFIVLRPDDYSSAETREFREI
jgi:hypothetical protein